MKQRYTRKELGAALRKLGLPISDSKLNKVCAPSVNLGPPVDVWFGRRPLYDIYQGIAWAESLLRSERSSLQDTTAKTGRAAMEAVALAADSATGG